MRGSATAPDFRRYQRYVAIGDSSTEGLDDPDGHGRYHGWADRLAAHLTRARRDAGLSPLLYANLGIRGRLTREIQAQQLAPALEMAPDLVTFFSGTNDVIRSGFDAAAVAAEIDSVHQAITRTGATLLTFTLPDLSPVMPAARRLVPRVEALNAAIHAAATRSGAVVVDLALYPVAVDPRLWSVDRLHANSAGHARIAAALAQALELPQSNPHWSAPLPPLAPHSWPRRAAAELNWAARCFIPWIWRHLWGRSSGDGIVAKRPILQPLDAATADLGT